MDPEAKALEMRNDPSTTKGVLLGQIGLGGAAPGAIVAFKAGPDEATGADDDQTFASIDALDALAGIGATTLDKILAFALNGSATLAV
ncbi:MAG: hypothetical protein ACI9WU_004215 [Myxococcota bacterium]|jgi:hypothetical protein